MQQAYQALRVISEAQTVHIVLAARPAELMLTELSASCASLSTGSGEGIKAVILDFTGQESASIASLPAAAPLLAQTCEAVRAIPQPVLAVVRASLSELACQLLAEADFTLVAHEAELCLPASPGELQLSEDNKIGGPGAARRGYATWIAPAGDLNREMERILTLLRTKSALALRNARAAVRLAQQETASPLEALSRVNAFYLEKVMTTEDAREGLRALQEKRQPRWKNR
jgi:enoyl-CoA hydratase/carnithine racemase